MKKKRTEIMIFILSIVVTISVIIPDRVFASAKDYTNPSVKVVYDTISAIDSHDWKAFVSLQCEENKDDFECFLNNEDNYLQKAGLFNINSASIYEMKELPLSVVASFTNIDHYLASYDSIAAYYAGINYSVSTESKYYYNGVNYSLIITGYELGQWKIVEFSDAPVESIIPLGFGFESEEEKWAMTVIKARISGTIIGSDGQYISSLSALRTIDEHARPNYVRVYRANLGYTESIDLYSYVKNVLPNEWISSWPSESLKSGALAVKMYGWYHTYHPKWPSLNADVKDTSVDQVYIPGSETTNTTTAINALDGIGLENSSGNIFETQYLAGTSGSAGSSCTGKISQWGSKYLVDNYNYGYLDICRYYYNYSDKSSGVVNTFTY